MATYGWLGEQVLATWGYNGRFCSNVFVNGIQRYADSIHVWGTQRLTCYGTKCYYNNRCGASVQGAGFSQIKPVTGYNYIGGYSWDKGFDVWIGCNMTQTSATLSVYYEDLQNYSWMHSTRYYTLYFNRYASAPSGLRQTATKTSYTGCSTSCSGINWGQGYSTRHLWLDMVWTEANNQRISHRMADWWNNDCGTSKTWSTNSLNIPVGCNVEFWWNAETNIGGDKDNCTTIWYDKSYPAPSLGGASIVRANIEPYKITTSISDVDFKYNYSERKLTCKISYELDGKSYSYIAGTFTDVTSASVTIDGKTLAPTKPWTKIPEDSEISITWEASNGNGVVSQTNKMKTLPQYEVFVIDDDGTVTPAEIRVSANKAVFSDVRRITSVQ